MQIKVLDNMQINVLGIMNNDLPDAINYENDEFHEYLMRGSYLYSFSVKKYKNGYINDDLDILKVGNHISFVYNEEKRIMKIMTLNDNISTMSFTCVDVTLELINEDTPKYTATTSMSLMEYFNLFTLQYGNIVVGINEVYLEKRKLVWDSTQTKIERLLSIVTQFDAECEFKFDFYNTGALKNIIVNIYKKNNGYDNQGVGQYKSDIVLTVGKDIDNIERKVDITNLFTAIRATGKNGLIANGISLSETNEDGVEEFYLRYGESIAFAPLARDMFPANIANAGTNGDTYILRTFETDYTTVADLGAYMMRTLKQFAYPVVEYTIDVSSSLNWKQYDIRVGDTIKIIDMRFGTQPLLLKVRVKEIVSSFENPGVGKLVLSNFVELKSKISSDIISTMNNIIDQNTPYSSMISSTGSLIFNNTNDTTTLSVSLSKGINSISDDGTITYKWYINDIFFGSDNTILINYNSLSNDTNVVTVDIYKYDIKISKSQISLSKVYNGKDAWSINMTNENVTLPANSDGVVTSYENSSTSISVSYGSGEALTPVMNGTQLLPNQFKVINPEYNLLTGTKDFIGTFNTNWNDIGTHYYDDGYYNGFKVKSTKSQWYGLFQEYTITESGTYTFSAFVKSDYEENEIHRFVTINGVIVYGEVIGHKFNWMRDSVVIPDLSAGDIIHVRYEKGNSDYNPFSVAGYKLEYNSTATPWMAAISESEITIGTQSIDTVSKTINYSNVSNIISKKGATPKIDYIIYICNKDSVITTIIKNQTFSKTEQGESPVNCVIESSAGNIFKNGQGSTNLTCRVYKSGSEIDISGLDYIYKWYQHDQNGVVNPNFGGNGVLYKTGKTLIVLATDINVKAQYICEIEK